MALTERHRAYWRRTLILTGCLLVVWFAVPFVAGYYAVELNTLSFLGFPLGYFLCAHGIFAIAVITVASFVNRQDAIDHWHGAHEDT